MTSKCWLSGDDYHYPVVRKRLARYDLTELENPEWSNDGRLPRSTDRNMVHHYAASVSPPPR